MLSPRIAPGPRIAALSSCGRKSTTRATRSKLRAAITTCALRARRASTVPLGNGAARAIVLTSRTGAPCHRRTIARLHALLGDTEKDDFESMELFTSQLLEARAAAKAHMLEREELRKYAYDLAKKGGRPTAASILPPRPRPHLCFSPTTSGGSVGSRSPRRRAPSCRSSATPRQRTSYRIFCTTRCERAAAAFERPR